jgi:EmrB/QacA subfamily drug resistance transporter
MTDLLPRGQLILATVGVMLSLLLAALDQTIVGTAMPRIVSELNGLDYYAWVTTAYLVTSTVVVPIAGKLGDLFGRKPFLLTGMVGFVAASALCGLSQNMFQLVIFRGIQGLFGGLLFASVFTVLADIFPPKQRARMQGLFGGVFGLSSVIGPTIGGYLTDVGNWRWVFYVNIPVGVLAVAAVAIALPYVRSQATWRDIDFLGSGVLTAGLIPLLIALSITRDHSWTSPEVMGLLGFAALALVAFFFVERRVRQPIIPFNMFRNNVFAVTVMVSFFSAFGMFGTIIFVPLLYQGVLGVSATNSGQLLTPMMLGLIVFSTLAGQVMTRIRYYRFISTVGVATMIVGMLLLSEVGIHTSQWEVVRDIVIVGAGLGLTFPVTLRGGPERVSARAGRRGHQPGPVLAQPGRHGGHRGPRVDPGSRAPQCHPGPDQGAASAVAVPAAKRIERHQPAVTVRSGPPGADEGLTAAAAGTRLRPGDHGHPDRAGQFAAHALLVRRGHPGPGAGGQHLPARGPAVEPRHRPAGGIAGPGDGGRERTRPGLTNKGFSLSLRGGNGRLP